VHAADREVRSWQGASRQKKGLPQVIQLLSDLSDRARVRCRNAETDCGLRRGRDISTEGTKERVRYYTGWIQLLWAGILLNGSGIVGLMLTLDSSARMILFISGLILEGIFTTLVFLAHRKINTLITKLEEAP